MVNSDIVVEFDNFPTATEKDATFVSVPHITRYSCVHYTKHGWYGIIDLLIV